jgi:hypothetical protein
VSDELRDLPRSGRGVLFCVFHRDADATTPSKFILQAVSSAARMRAVLKASGSDIKLCLFTDRANWQFLLDPRLCRPGTYDICAQFAALDGAKVFDDVLFIDDFEVPPVKGSKRAFNKWPGLWFQRIIAFQHSPYAQTLMVDSDVYACPRFDTIFSYLDARHLVAATLSPMLFGDTFGNAESFRSGFPDSYERFPERNLGLIVVQSSHPKVIELLALFRDVYLRHMRDPKAGIHGDQSSFREALFTMRIEVRDNVIPHTVGCRYELGCDDGCLSVHRHHDRDKSGGDVKVVGLLDVESLKKKKKQGPKPIL